VGELTERGYVEDDATALAALFNRIEEHLGGHPYATADRTRAEAASLLRDPTIDSRMVFDHDGALLGAAFAATPPDGGFRADMLGGVDPAWQGRRGLSRDLLDWQLRRGTELHDTLAPDREWQLHFGVTDNDTVALRLYRRFDLTPIRFWFEMVAPTAVVPGAAAPGGVDIVDYVPGREIELYQAHEEAFADHWGHQDRGADGWLAQSVRSARFLPELSRFALAGDAIAGYVLPYRSPVPGRGYIGQVGVRRPWRRRGLAGAMLAQVLRACAHAGFETASLGVDAQNPTGAVGLYRRLGFAVESRGVTNARVLPAKLPAARPPS
jgi:ribosomal protein S18 acetylase RimI-like enzyme